MPTVLPVQALIPTVREVTAVSNSALNLLTAIKSAMETPGQRWQLGEFTLNGSSQVTALVLEYGSMQLCLRATSSTQLLASLHPEGGISDINAPSTPTGSTERTINGYADGPNLLPSADGRIQIGEFEGAISIFFRLSSGQWFAGLHAGQIYYADNLNDEENGFEGYGLLIGRVGALPSNVRNYREFSRSMWLHQQYNLVETAKLTGSTVRVPGNLWVVPTPYSLANQFTLETSASTAVPNDVDTNPRLQPIKIGVRGPSNSARINGIIGSLRFVRNTFSPPTQIVDSDQYWSTNYFKYATTSTSDGRSYEIRNLVFAWNKNYVL